MITSKIKLFIGSLSILICGMSACMNFRPESNNKGSIEKLESAQQHNLVKVKVLRIGNFVQEFISNGKVRAVKKTEMKFFVAGRLQAINVRNGMYVNTGQAIAALDQFEFKQRLEQDETALKKASMDLEDLMLARGFNLVDSAVMPREIFQKMLLRSGYSNAKRDVKTSQYNIGNTILHAPFSGKIANISRKKYEQVSTGEVFCLIVDDSEFEVEFSMMETEFREVDVDDRVNISPFSKKDAVLVGHISEINPVVDEHGLVLVKALVKNYDGQLMEGMNVRVSIKRDIRGQLVIPKSAIVVRQNHEVVFKYSKGRSVWVYVRIMFENSDSFSVIADPEKQGNLSEYDTIIVSGNFNLAHNAPIEILQ